MIDYESKDWIGILANLRGSVLPRLVVRMGIAVLFGAVAVAMKRLFEFHVNPVAHGLIGVALGLLLVFRTNASYDRFWEGRKLVGQLVIATRDLTRQIAVHVERPEDRLALRRHVLAFYQLFVQRLRDQDDLPALAELLDDEERLRLEGVKLRAPVVATWLTARLARVVGADAGGEARMSRMDANVASMMAALAGCERIRFTPVPFAYAQHIKVFLTIFCFTSPFAIVDGLGLWTPFAAAALALALFGIDEIGVEIEDPFGTDPNDLPLDALGAALASTTTEMLESEGPVLDSSRGS